MAVLLILIINAGLAFIPANMAKNKGYSFGGFWCLSFFISFLVGIIVAACLTDKREFVRRDEIGGYDRHQTQFEKYCVHCGNGMYNDELFCSRCGAKKVNYTDA